MPGSFDNLKIDDGHLYPQGPLEVLPGETDAEVYAWVMQPGAFIQCEGRPTSDGKSWVTAKVTDERGTFTPGKAMATGTLVTQAGSKQNVFWWATEISLS